MFSSGINFSFTLKITAIILCLSMTQPTYANFLQEAGAAAQAIGAFGQGVTAGIQANTDKYIAGLNAATSLKLAEKNNQLQRDLMDSSVGNSMIQTLSTLRIKAMDIAANLERAYLTTNYSMASTALQYKDKSEERQQKYRLLDRQLKLEEKKGEAEIALKTAQLVADLATRGLVTGFKAVGSAALGVTRIFSGRHTNTMKASNNLSSPKAFSLKPKSSTLKGFTGAETRELSRSFTNLFERSPASGSTVQRKQKTDIPDFMMAAQPHKFEGTPHRSGSAVLEENSSQTHGSSRSFIGR